MNAILQPSHWCSLLNTVPAFSRGTSNRAVQGAPESTLSCVALSVPEKAFFLVVHDLIHARGAFFIIASIRVSSPVSTAVNSFYARSVLATELYSGWGPTKAIFSPSYCTAQLYWPC